MGFEYAQWQGFDPPIPLQQYPDRIADPFRVHAAYLRAELDTRFLEVALIEADPIRHSGHKIRVAVNTNPLWYRRLYDDRRIRRPFVKASLERIRNARDLTSNARSHVGSSIYDGELRGVIFGHLVNGIEDELNGAPVFHPPDPAVVALFDAYFR
jgi:hypothetical protein